jgi:hypothetical protein
MKKISTMQVFGNEIFKEQKPGLALLTILVVPAPCSKFCLRRRRLEAQVH